MIQRRKGSKETQRRVTPRSQQSKTVPRTIIILTTTTENLLVILQRRILRLLIRFKSLITFTSEHVEAKQLIAIA